MTADRKYVLVADDYDDAAMLLATLVGLQTPFDTDSAKDGQEVVELARARRPDAAVLDLDMPRVGGIAAARELRAEFPDAPPLLIAVSGKSSEEAQASGVFDFVFTKPVELSLLLERLREI
jgi:CheY-like chemotaxis protein